jgi:5-methyltetrahydropteroyltriglutamate--homocysteine methyltransferase
MKISTDHILTSHVGSLPRSPEVLKLIHAKASGEDFDASRYDAGMRRVVGDAVRRQADVGIDIVNDGEQTKTSFIAYICSRMGGFEFIDPSEHPGLPPTRDALAFPAVYDDLARLTAFRRKETPLRLPRMWMRCTGPIRYTGYEDLKADIEWLKAGLGGVPAEEAFMTSISPSNLELNHRNEFYRTGEEYLTALCDAMHEEYKAIVDAGLILQIDDPRMATHFDRTPGASIEECRRFIALRVEAVNYALRGIPEDRVRLHTCYSVNTAPRVHDLELRDYVDLMLKVRAQAYSIEAANPRHEHEWQVFQDVKLPDGKILLPGMVSHCVALVEHPELVAQRILRWAWLVGRENVIASADCGFGTSAALDEVHPDVAWAKLQALGEGARIASKELWGRG